MCISGVWWETEKTGHLDSAFESDIECVAAVSTRSKKKCLIRTGY